MCEFELPDVSLRCFVARQLLLRIYALSSVKFSGLKLWLCKKCDKYEVWPMYIKNDRGVFVTHLAHAAILTDSCQVFVLQLYLGGRMVYSTLDPSRIWKQSQSQGGIEVFQEGLQQPS